MLCTLTVRSKAEGKGTESARITIKLSRFEFHFVYHFPCVKPAVLQSLFNHLREAHNRRDVHAIVVTGANGKAWLI